jgi:hypothetical protein
MSTSFTDAKPGPGGWAAGNDVEAGQIIREACCDCGLVHEREFRIVRITGEKSPRGKPLVEEVGDKDLRIACLVRRDDETTAVERRERDIPDPVEWR